MARGLLEQGNVAQADSLLDARVAADPDDWRAAWYRGIGALAADDTRTAGRLFAFVCHELAR